MMRSAVGKVMLVGRTTVFMVGLAMMVALMIGATSVVARPAHAQTVITVNTNADENNTDGDCSLREAIIAANTNQATDACPAGSSDGEDAIGFNLGSSATTITLSSQLPNITDAAGLVIDGGAQANVTVSGNDAVRIFYVTSGAKFAVRNLTIAHGEASGGLGGGIYNEGTLEVANSTFSRNTASQGSAIASGSVWDNSTLHRGNLTVNNSTFSNNSGIYGGIYNGSFSNAWITNSTFYNGGIENGQSDFQVSNSTFYDGGIKASGGEGGQIILRDTILASSDDFRDDVRAGNCAGLLDVIWDFGYNISDDTTCQLQRSYNSMFNREPLLDPDGLQDNGGPTKTIALQPTSPVIDQGNSFGAITDQRGQPRPYNFPNVQNAYLGDGSDIGAFEKGPNSRPQAMDDKVSTEEDTPQDIPVLNNDTDPDPDDTLALTGVFVDPAHGQLTQNSDGTINYAPEKDYNGEDSFFYTVKDALGETDIAKVTITVSAVNDAPSFELGAAPNQTVNEDAGAQSVVGFVKSISAGPSDEATQKVSFTLSNDNSSLFSGQPQISPEGTLTYTPAPNAFGNATVKVRATDDGGIDNSGTDTSAEQSFTIEVSAINDAPEAADDTSYATAEDTYLTVGAAEGVLNNDTDIENDALRAQKASDPSHGALTLNEDGSFTYTPDANFNGTDSFTYRATDGTLQSNIATVTIQVKDTTKPTISPISPKPRSAIGDTTPTIKATVKDNFTNLQKANIKLYVNNKLISATKYSYSAAKDLLTYNSSKLSAGKNTVKIVATDAAKNVGTKSWYFTIK